MDGNKRKAESGPSFAAAATEGRKRETPFARAPCPDLEVCLRI
jgi:hypothetical protein